jgi:hypothetical protein
MKIIITVIFLTFSNVSFASSYDAFVGCYKLVSVNGAPVTSSRVSFVRVGSPKWYYQLNNSNLNGLVATIIEDKPGEALIYEPLAFDNAPGAEVVEASANKLQFHFSGKLKSKWDWQVHSLEYTTSFEKASGGQLFVSSDSSEDGRPRNLISFGLVAVACP